MAKVEYQGRQDILIDTSYHIQYRPELKYFLFALFLLNAHRAAGQPQKRED